MRALQRSKTKIICPKIRPILADQNTTQYWAVTISSKYCCPLVWSNRSTIPSLIFQNLLDTYTPWSRWPILPCTWQVRVLLNMDYVI